MFIFSTSTKKSHFTIYNIHINHNNGFLLMELLIAIFFKISFLIIVSKCHVTSMHLIRKFCKRIDAINIATSCMEIIPTESELLKGGKLVEKSYAQGEFQIKWNISPTDQFYHSRVIVPWNDEKRDEPLVLVLAILAR